MSHTVKLLIAVVLGGIAAILNWVVISQRTNSVKFAALSQAVPAGETITTDMITSIDVESQYAESLEKSVIPWSEKAVLSGRVAVRDLEPGVLLLWDDVPVRGPRYDLREGETAVFIDVSDSPASSIAVGEHISFRFASDDNESMAQWVGPFRVVTVGEKRVPGDRTDGVREISVAMPEVAVQPQHASLQAYIDRQTKDEVTPLQIRAHVNP